MKPYFITCKEAMEARLLLQVRKPLDCLLMFMVTDTRKRSKSQKLHLVVALGSDVVPDAITQLGGLDSSDSEAPWGLVS